eukprot:gene31195-40556_t
MKVINVHFFDQPQLADDINELTARDTFTMQRPCFKCDEVLAEAMIHLAGKYRKDHAEMIGNPVACELEDIKFETSKDGLTINFFVCFPIFYKTILADINAAQLIADMEADENVDILVDGKSAAKNPAAANRKKMKARKPERNTESNCDESDSMKEDFSQSVVADENVDLLVDGKSAAKKPAAKNRKKKKAKKQERNTESNCDESDSMKEDFSQSVVVPLVVNLTGEAPDKTNNITVTAAESVVVADSAASVETAAESVIVAVGDLDSTASVVGTVVGEDAAMVQSTSSPIIQPPILVETVVQCSRCDQVTAYLQTIVSNISALQSSVHVLAASNSALKTSVNVLEASNSALKTSVNVLEASNSALKTSNSLLKIELEDVKDMCTRFETEIADLKTTKKEEQPQNDNNRRLAIMMQRVQRRALVAWMRTYLKKKTCAEVPRDKQGLPMWQEFITRVSEDSAFLKREGLTAESLLFLNEAVGTNGEASNRSAHDFERRDLEAAISPQSNIKPGPHWPLYFNKFCSTVV